MPQFHVYLVEDDGREHIGSIDLPSEAEVIPAGLKLTTKFLAAITRQYSDDNGLLIQATDHAGKVLYKFKAWPSIKDGTSISGYLH